MKKNIHGFTLLEILIALFIFTMLSMMLMGALHSVITADSGTEKNAQRLRIAQIALLTMSRDIEQTVDRPVLNTTGTEEAALIGSSRGFTLTHTGFANPMGTLLQSTLQRTRYYWDQGALWRMTWTALDQAPSSRPHAKRLLTEITAAQFEYLDKEGRFYNDWPPDDQKKQSLPRAIRVLLTISQWGKLSQLYVISAEPNESTLLPLKP
jgi:general secretion pathway protein J